MTIPAEVLRNIRRIEIRTSRLVEDLLGGAYRSAFKGKGMEFEDVREYVEGDEVRAIDWNVTARMNRPYVKNFSEERELTVMLMVDVSASCRFGSGNRLKSEVIAELAAVLGFSAIKNNDRVGLILFSDEVEKYIPAKKGAHHVLRIIRELLFFQPAHLGTNIKEALAFLNQVRHRSCIAFLFSDFICPESAKEMLITSKRHDLIAVQVMDPQEHIFPPSHLVHFSDLESGEKMIVDTNYAPLMRDFTKKAEARLEKHKALMKKMGIESITVSTDKPYVESLRHFFKKRERRH
jgi:uncharacterized protein (DUF58 family)